MEQKLDAVLWYWRIGIVILSAVLLMELIKATIAVVMLRRDNARSDMLPEMFKYIMEILRLSRGYLEQGNAEKHTSRQQLKSEIGETVRQAVADAAPAVVEKVAEVVKNPDAAAK